MNQYTKKGRVNASKMTKAEFNCYMGFKTDECEGGITGYMVEMLGDQSNHPYHANKIVWMDEEDFISIYELA